MTNFYNAPGKIKVQETGPVVILEHTNENKSFLMGEGEKKHPLTNSFQNECPQDTMSLFKLAYLQDTVQITRIWEINL